MTRAPSFHDIAHLGHVELLTPNFDASLAFFTDIVGLHEVARHGPSAFLRAWGEWFHHSLVVTEGPQPALGHIGWRAEGAEELEIAANRLDDSGLGEDWYEHATGHGPAYRFRGPGGQLTTFTLEWYLAAVTR